MLKRIVWQVDPAQMTTYYNLSLCDALAEQGCQVRYVTSKFLYDEELPTHNTFTVDHHYFRGLGSRALLKHRRSRQALRALSYPIGHIRLYRKIRQLKPDIIHFQWSRLPRLDILLISRVRKLGIPVVHTIHDIVPLFADKGSTDYLGQVYRSVDALIVHTEDSRRALLQQYPGIQASRIHLIPLIATKNTAIPIEASRDSARRALGLPVDAPVFLFFGSVKQYKGLDILAGAFEEVKQKRSDAWLLVAGRPDKVDQVRLLNRIQASSNTQVHAGFIPYSDVWKYHYAADVIVFPYRHIYQSGALITSLNFGRAVIVADVGGLAEAVDGNGTVVPPENVGMLTEAMLHAISDPARLEQMGKRSVQIVEERFSQDLIARQTMRVYERLYSTPVVKTTNWRQ